MRKCGSLTRSQWSVPRCWSVWSRRSERFGHRSEICRVNLSVVFRYIDSFLVRDRQLAHGRSYTSLNNGSFPQVIFAGDFFQLQPVRDKETYTDKDQFLNRGLAFEASAWHRANLEVVMLKTIFRQVSSTPKSTESCIPCLFFWRVYIASFNEDTLSRLL